MHLKLEDPLILAKPIEIISDLVLEVRIKISEYGLSLIAMDPANVAMINFKIPKSAFSEFQADSEILGINLDSLKKVLKRCGKTSSLILEKQDNVLTIKIEDKIKRTFSLGLIEIESEERELPQLEYCSAIELDSQDLIDAIEDVSVISDACSFIVKDNTFIIETKEIDAAKVEFSAETISIKGENCKARYSLEYLQKFMKAAKICDRTKIQFASNHPLRLDFGNNFFGLTFILAPRMETED